MFKKISSDTYEKLKDDPTIGSSGSPFELNCDSRRLLDLIGQPSSVGSGDDKVQLEWIFQDGEKILTVYDYKEICCISRIPSFYVGSKGMNREEVRSALIELGFDRIDEIVE